jgi:hypothetical protein
MPEIETRDWRQMSDLKDLPRLLSGGLQGLVSRDQLAQASALLDLEVEGGRSFKLKLTEHRVKHKTMTCQEQLD